MKVEVNKDEELVKEVREQLKENGGYCPCMIEKTEETKCMCKDFLENIKEGFCHCGLYKKILEV